MALGIDLGTTRTVVACTDHGNTPLVSFDGDSGDTLSAWPATIAWRDDELVFGLDAEAKKAQGWDWLPSLKPLLGELGPQDTISLGDQHRPLLELLSAYLRQLRHDLRSRSNLPADADIDSIWIAVPANANSSQRYLTMEGFHQAGFEVMGMLNEPAAAGMEYVQQHHPAGSRKRHLAIYDLGGGTFDAATVTIDDRRFEVLSNAGLSRLGGNDFDQLLMDMALEQSGQQGALSAPARLTLLEECRERKEGLTANTRRIIVDLGRALDGAEEVIIDAKAFYARCAPLVQRSIAATEQTLSRIGSNGADLAAVYLVGGSCMLPIVARLLREQFGRRVRKSAHPHAATAIGLAIAASGSNRQQINDRFTRNFGVWREWETGRSVAFDPIFTKDTPLPGPSEPPLVHVRRYRPVHNIGHFRYLECSGVGTDGQPQGDVTPWDAIQFPLDPELARHDSLAGQTIKPWPEGSQQIIEEHYACDANGVIEVTICNQSAGYQRRFQLRGCRA